MNNLLDALIAAKLAGGGGGGGGTGLTDDVKQALLNCFAHVAWIDDQGQSYYDALEDALYPTAPPAELLSISAVFEQGQTVIYDTDSLDDLKPMLTVTAHYSDSTSAVVVGYTLSGTLTAGTSTITVSYGGKTATFDVTVSTHVLYSLENRSFSNEAINTGIILFDEDKDFTAAIDMNITALPSSGTGSQPRILALTNEAADNFALAVTIKLNTSTYFNYMGSGGAITSSSVSTGRLRAVVTHSKNSGSASLAMRIGSGNKIINSVSATFAVASNRTLRFGFGTGNNTLPTGTINKAYIYDYAMTDAEINAFLGL